MWCPVFTFAVDFRRQEPTNPPADPNTDICGGLMFEPAAAVILSERHDSILLLTELHTLEEFRDQGAMRALLLR
jgi:hypothetical protein